LRKEKKKSEITSLLLNRKKKSWWVGVLWFFFTSLVVIKILKYCSRVFRFFFFFNNVQLKHVFGFGKDKIRFLFGDIFVFWHRFLGNYQGHESVLIFSCWFFYF
jgi:hypothetical protein